MPRQKKFSTIEQQKKKISIDSQDSFNDDIRSKLGVVDELSQPDDLVSQEADVKLKVKKEKLEKVIKNVSSSQNLVVNKTKHYDSRNRQNQSSSLFNTIDLFPMIDDVPDEEFQLRKNLNIQLNDFLLRMETEFKLIMSQTQADF